MFKMMSLHSDACQKSLINGLINDGLTEVWPHLNQMLFQLINITYAFLIHPVLKTASNSVVNSIRGCYVARGRARWILVFNLPGKDNSRAARHMQDGGHGNGCSWYSAALIILMVNYKILIYELLWQFYL